MKKYIILLFAGLALNLSAQDVATTSDETAEKLVSKKGIAILPEAGEFSLGIDAYPFLNYLGSIMSNDGANTPYLVTPDSYYSYGITGKYMLTNKSAVRASLYTEFSSEKSYYTVRKSELTPDELNPQFVEDTYTDNEKDIVLSVGIEKRRGKSRVQGIYGIDAVLGMYTGTEKYSYGNPITVDFTTPEIYLNGYGSYGERLTEYSTYNSYIFGAKAFVGIEYFIGPKISLGGELAYGVIYQTQGNSQYTYEYWNSVDLVVDEMYRDATYNGYSDFGLYTNTYGSINLNFYF